MNPDSFQEKYNKPVLRFFYYQNQRKKVFREIGIRSRQNKMLEKRFDPETEALIVFLVPGADWYTGKDAISGGVLSIASLYEETEKLKDLHGCSVMMCTFPKAHLLLKHTNFENDIPVFRFEQLTQNFPKLRKLILHIPELFVEYFGYSLNPKQVSFLRNLSDLHINILNQNVRLMPDKVVIQSLFTFTSKITITTAHAKYCTAQFRELYGVPLHFFSTFASPESYRFVPYQEKENIMVLSPDDAEKNSDLMAIMKTQLPNLELIVIQNLSYQAYKSLIAKAKWSITFGEGLDFYFIEPVFSGSISFALYNELFFTPDFKELPTVYSSYASLKEGIVDQIRKLDNEADYNRHQKPIFDRVAQYYSREQYRNNIADFYRAKYTHA